LLNLFFCTDSGQQIGAASTSAGGKINIVSLINAISDGLAVNNIFIINNEKEGILVRRKKPFFN